MRRTRAAAALGALLVAATAGATLLSGCTTQGNGTGASVLAAQPPAPRARITAGVAAYAPVTDQRLVSP